MKIKSFVSIITATLILSTPLLPSMAQSKATQKKQAKIATTKSSKKKKFNKTQQGAIIGATTGAVIGAIIGKSEKNTAIGAIIGATVGGGAGALIGKYMDEKAERLREELGPDTKVERVGEGVKVTMGDNLLFDFGSSALRTESMIKLKSIAETLRKDNKTDILVEGNTDNIGSASFNKNLSELRAKAVEDYLIVEGLGAERIKTIGMGEGHPVATNSTEAGRQQNRRVEIGIFANDNMKKDLIQSGANLLKQ